MNKGLDAVKTASKIKVHKTSEFMRNKIADEVTKSSDDMIEKQEPVEEIIIPPEKRRNIKQTEKLNTIKYLNH